MKHLRLILDYTSALLPPVGVFMMTFYTFARAMDYELSILEVLFGPSLLFTVLLMIMAWREHHTKFFNICLLYILVVQLCIHYHRQIGFTHVQPMRWMVVAIGVMLISYFISTFDSFILHNLNTCRPVHPQPSVTPEQLQKVIEPISDAVSCLNDRIEELEHDAHPDSSSELFSVIDHNEK